MTAVLETCSICQGRCTVPHIRKPLLEGEIRHPCDLDMYKVEDICEACGGDGKVLIEVSVSEKQQLPDRQMTRAGG